MGSTLVIVFDDLSPPGSLPTEERPENALVCEVPTYHHNRPKNSRPDGALIEVLEKIVNLVN